ncbi:MAG: FKBP-type peptidyl-prolyl cis-trans isomerase [Ginsengibacter sp.]
MKRLLALSVFTLFIFSSCLKNDSKCGYSDSTIVAPNAERQALGDSLDKYGITNATMDASGFYYTIENPGTGRSVSNLCSNILVTYKGSFFDGRVFDSTQINSTVNPPSPIPASFQLGRVITGWQKGIPLLKVGGDINLYIPPSLGYGAVDVPDPRTNQVVIPKNSYLVFKVHVIDIQ